METFTHDIDGVGELRFAHLTVYDVFGDPDKPEANGFIPLHRERLKRKLRKNLDALDYSRDEKLSYLDGFDRKTLDLNDFIQYMEEPTSSAELVRFAWRGANDDKPLPPIPPDDETAVVWKLVAPLGIRPKKPAENPDAPPPPGYGEEGGQAENPPIPPTYSSSTATVETTTAGGTGSPTGA
jgi:hypothetical protein